MMQILAVLTCVFLSSCSYDDLVGILNMERQLCDRKLDQLTSKRRDEEDRRAILSKRVARAKVVTLFNCIYIHIIVL